MLRKSLRISIRDILEFGREGGTRECRDLRFTYYNRKENVKSGFSTDGRDLRPRAVNTRIAKGTADLTILRPRADRRWKSCALSAWSFLLWDIRASSKFSKHFHRRRFVHRCVCLVSPPALVNGTFPKRNRSFFTRATLTLPLCIHCVPYKRYFSGKFFHRWFVNSVGVWIIFNNKTLFCLADYRENLWQIYRLYFM